MPRDIPVGNGRLLICFDREYSLRELFYPHVGQENHVFGRFCRLGVWVDQQFSWIGPDWQKHLGYLEDTMVTEVTLYHPGLQVVLHCGDAVDFHEDVYVKEVSVENIASYKREVRLFFSLDLGISGNDIGNQAVIIKFWVNFAATIDSEARAKELGVMKLMRDLGLLR